METNLISNYIYLIVLLRDQQENIHIDDVYGNCWQQNDIIHLHYPSVIIFSYIEL